MFSTMLINRINCPILKMQWPRSSTSPQLPSADSQEGHQRATLMTEVVFKEDLLGEVDSSWSLNDKQAEKCQRALRVG
jgi:hypothetical protein